MIVSTRGVDFTVRVGGPEDGAPVLLLHGFPEHGGMWDEVAATLNSAGLKTFAPDLRGYSSGTSSVDDFAMPRLVDDVLALLDELGLARVDLVGHDWGSILGWHLAGSHAPRVKSFTAVSVPHPDAVFRALGSDGGDQRQRSSYMTFFAMAGTAEDLLLADGGERLWGIFDPLPRDVAAKYVTPLLERDNLTGALNWYRALTWPPVGPAPIPVTFIYGEDDIAIGPAAANACVDFVAGDYRFVSLAGISHWVVDQVPEVVAAEALSRASASR